jgi:Bacteriocin-protection, YdeI or OmpD-Associated/Domain of unknown function (DUF1905)
MANNDRGRRTSRTPGDAGGPDDAGVTFRTTIQAAMKTATGIVVPDEVVAALGAGKKPPVVVTINGASYRSTLAVMGGRCMVGVSAQNRALTGVAAGDDVDVRLALDTAPRTVEVPDDLGAALAGEPAAKTFFDGLSVSQRKWFVLSVESAKTAETRQRRVGKALELLRAGKAR